jgi:hypothetical protein
MKLTLDELKKMQPHTIFARGSGLIPELNKDKKVKWIALRGYIPDWAIYYDDEDKSEENIRDWGNKCFTEVVIKNLVPCNDEALKAYRL